MAALNAAAPKITDRLCEPCAEHFAAVRAHLDALEVALPARARARPRPRLLHADGVRVLRHRSRGPAAGHRWRRTLRRPGRAARRSAHAGHRVRDRHRPVDPRARRDGRGDGRGARPGRGRGRRRPRRHGRPAAPRHEPPCGGHRGAGGARSPQARQAARGGRARSAPISRSSSATSWRPARSGCATCRPGPRSSSRSATSPARSSAATARIGTAPRRTSPAAAGRRRSSRRR